MPKYHDTRQGYIARINLRGVATSPTLKFKEKDHIPQRLPNASSMVVAVEVAGQTVLE